MSPSPSDSDTKLERVIHAAIAPVASALVLIEIVVLAVGVVSRFVFHRPLVWVDELASMCFLWLAMMGATVALLRREHMGLTALVLRFSPAKRLAARALVEAVIALFLILHSALGLRIRA